MRHLSTLILVAVLSLASSSAEAACAPRDVVVKSLARDFGEYPTFVGVQKDGNSLIEFFVSEDGSWTLIESFADGKSCGRASGPSWVQLPSDEPST